MPVSVSDAAVEKKDTPLKGAHKQDGDGRREHSIDVGKSTGSGGCCDSTTTTAAAASKAEYR